MLTLSSKKKEQNPRRSLLDLPPEIRNLIYTFVFSTTVDEVPLPLSQRKHNLPSKLLRKVGPKHKRTRTLSLLQTCHQIRTEALDYRNENLSANLHLNPRSIRWMLKQVFLNSSARQIHEALSNGSYQLSLVTHLHLTGSSALRMLTHRQYAGIQKDRDSRFWFVRTSAHTSDAIVAVRNRLENVRCITIADTGDVALGPTGLVEVLVLALPILPEEVEQVRKVFPRMRELRVVAGWIGLRFGKVEGRGWKEWYSGEDAEMIEI